MMIRLLATLGLFLDLAQAQLYSLKSQDEFVCDYEAVKRNTEIYEGLESLEEILTKQTEPPVMMEATNVEGAEPHLYNGFYIRPIYFEGLPYKNNCTLVFGWLSTPLVSKEEDGVAGAILLHGGGATAFKEWNERWARNGMASLAIGLEGQTDEGQNGRFTSTPFPGPRRVGAYCDSQLPIPEQWMYHTMAQSIMANTLLRAQHGVNADNVGVAGVSWGGVIAATLISFDYDRLAFAIPAYGCGSMAKSPSGIARQMSREGAEGLYERVWDPTMRYQRLFRRMDASRMPPTLWISWPGETNFPIERQMHTYQTLRQHGAEVMVLLVGQFAHSHGIVWRRPESYFFVKSVLDSRKKKLLNLLPEHVTTTVHGSVYATQVDSYVIKDETKRVQAVVFESVRPFLHGELYFSCEANPQLALYEQQWNSRSVDRLDELGCEENTNKCTWLVSFTEGAEFYKCAWFINLKTNNGLVVSTSLNHHEEAYHGVVN